MSSYEYFLQSRVATFLNYFKYKEKDSIKSRIKNDFWISEEPQTIKIPNKMPNSMSKHTFSVSVIFLRFSSKIIFRFRYTHCFYWSVCFILLFYNYKTLANYKQTLLLASPFKKFMPTFILPKKLILIFSPLSEIWRNSHLITCQLLF